MNGDNKKWYLPKKYMGEYKGIGGGNKTKGREWTKDEENWLLMLVENGFTKNEISEFMGRSIPSLENKLRRLRKGDGESYNESHRPDKYKHNQLFLDIIKPKTVLDLYSGEVSYYEGKVKRVYTNDKNKKFKTDYSEYAEKLVCKLFYENKKYDVIDIDPFGSGFDCFDLCIKMAKNGVIITLGEMGHKRRKRLDYVKRYYGITNFEDFTSENIIKEIIKIGHRNKKELIPVFVKDYKSISRVYFKIETKKITEQWEKSTKDLVA